VRRPSPTLSYPPLERRKRFPKRRGKKTRVSRSRRQKKSCFTKAEKKKREGKSALLLSPSDREKERKDRGSRFLLQRHEEKKKTGQLLCQRTQLEKTDGKKKNLDLTHLRYNQEKKREEKKKSVFSSTTGPKRKKRSDNVTTFTTESIWTCWRKKKASREPLSPAVKEKKEKKKGV